MKPHRGKPRERGSKAAPGSPTRPQGRAYYRCAGRPVNGPKNRKHGGAGRSSDLGPRTGIVTPPSIPVFLPQPRREAQNPLHALELVEPVLHDGGEGRVAGADHAAGARLARLHAGQLAVARQGAVAVAGDLVAVLAEE